MESSLPLFQSQSIVILPGKRRNALQPNSPQAQLCFPAAVEDAGVCMDLHVFF